MPLRPDFWHQAVMGVLVLLPIHLSHFLAQTKFHPNQRIALIAIKMISLLSAFSSSIKLYSGAHSHSV